jgi:hypothetical protein
MVLVYIGEASNVSEGEESIKITLKKKAQILELKKRIYICFPLLCYCVDLL